MSFCAFARFGSLHACSPHKRDERPTNLPQDHRAEALWKVLTYYLRARIAAHHQAGANHVCIQAFRPDGGPGPDLATLERLAPNA